MVCPEKNIAHINGEAQIVQSRYLKKTILLNDYMVSIHLIPFYFRSIKVKSNL